MAQEPDLQKGMRILDQHGAVAEIVEIDNTGTERLAVAQFADGKRLAFPLALLNRDGTSVRFAGRFDELSALAGPPAGAQAQDGQSHGEPENATVIPVIKEQMEVSKRTVDTGRGLRLEKTVDQHEEIIDLPLLRDELVIERVARDVLLAEGETVARREEGDTMIIPVLEEVLVVQKRIRLREEIHITRRRNEFHAPQKVVLRSEKVDVNRFDDNVPK